MPKKRTSSVTTQYIDSRIAKSEKLMDTVFSNLLRAQTGELKSYADTQTAKLRSYVDDQTDELKSYVDGKFDKANSKFDEVSRKLDWLIEKSKDTPTREEFDELKKLVIN